MPDDYDLKGEYEQARQFVGEDFYTQRKAWDAVVERRAPVSSKDHPEDDYQTAELEKAEDDWVDGLVDPPTLIDVILLDKDTQQNRKKRDTVRLGLASMWKHQLNKDRWYDIARSFGQVRPGIHVGRLCWNPIEEPDTDVLKGSEYAKGRTFDDVRDEAMKLQGPTFYLEDIDLYGFAWTEYERKEDYAIFCAEIPVLEAQRKYTKKQGDTTYKPIINEVGHLGWLADPRAEDSEAPPQARKRVKLYVRDGRSLDGRMCPMPGCNHPMRTISVYLCGVDQDVKDAEKVNEVDSPFKHCSFKITSARARNHRDPHLRFRGPLYPLLVEAAEINHRETLLSAQVREDYEGRGFYIDGSKVDPNVSIGEEGQVKETYKMPKPGADEVPVLPASLSSVPSHISPHLMEQITSSRERMQDYKPNRWLNGQAFEEANDVPATIGLQQAQGAAKPFNRLLEQQDATTQEILEDIIHAICYWDYGVPASMQHKYYFTALGNEDLMTGEAEAGTESCLTADLLSSIRFELRLLTQSETLAEQNARYLAAQAKYDKGLITFEQLMEASGIRDTTRQTRLLLKDQVRMAARPMQMELILLGLKRTFAARTGMDVTALGGPVPALPQGGGDTAHPSVQGVTGRFIQPAPVEGPRGGNQPL